MPSIELLGTRVTPAFQSRLAAVSMNQMTPTELAYVAAVAREVVLTTFGRISGRPSRRTIWITVDASGRVHVRSGQGVSRDWPRNLIANPRAVLHINGRDVRVSARHVTDRAELRASHDALPASRVGARGA